jgi:hypothetical protein
MDRLNLATAAIAGLNAELKLQVGTRYSVVILTFFAAYTVFQPLGTYSRGDLDHVCFSAPLCWHGVLS